MFLFRVRVCRARCLCQETTGRDFVRADIIGRLRKEVKPGFLEIFGRFATLPAVARHETFAALVAKMAPNESWEAFAARAGVTSRTLRTLRSGGGKRPFRTTVAKLAKALRVEAVRVEAAIEASAAAQPPER